MKRALLTLLVCANASAQEANTVRMSLQAYEDLKARSAQQDPDEDVPDDEGEGAVPRVLEARLAGQLTRKALSLELRVTVEGTGRGWHVLPIVPSDMALLDATITGGGTLILADGMRALAFAGPGKRTLVAHLYTSGVEAGAARQLELNVLPATSRQIQLEIAKGVDAELTPDALISMDRSGGKRVLKGFVAAGDGELSLRWSTAGMRDEEAAPTPERPKPAASKEPARINVQANMLASVGERLLTVYTTLRYTIFHAPVSRFEWTVPAGVEVIGVQGRGVTDWTCSSGAGERACFVELPFPVQRAYELSVQLEQPLPKEQKTVTVPAPIAKGVQRQSGHVAVEVMGNAEVTPGTGGTAIPGDVRDLPGDLFAGQGTPILLAFKFNEAGVKVVLDIQRRESEETSPISVEQARYTTVWTSQGSTITEASYLIRNRQRQFLEVTLPRDSVIQSAFVSDMPVKPSSDNDGKLRIPLPNGRGSDAEAFPVQLVYSRDNQPLPPLGRVTAELPVLDSEIGAVQHTLILPDRQHLWAFGGDLSIESPRVVDDSVINRQGNKGGFMGPLGGARGFANATNEEQMQFAGNAAEPMQEEDGNMRERAKKDVAKQAARRPMAATSNIVATRRGGGVGAGAANTFTMLAGLDANDDDPAPPPPVGNTGVLPVRIQIPSGGDRYTAHGFYVPPLQALTWHARIANGTTRNTLLGVMLVLGILMGMSIMRGKRNLLRLGGMNRDQMLFAATLVLSLLLTFYFRRQMLMMPGFVVLGILGTWTMAKIKAQQTDEEKSA